MKKMNKATCKKHVWELSVILSYATSIDCRRSMDGSVTYVVNGINKKTQRPFKVSYTFILNFIERYKNLKASITDEFTGDYRKFLEEELEDCAFLATQMKQLQDRYYELLGAEDE